MYVAECPPNKICAPTKLLNSTCVSNTTTQGFPGDYCQVSADCVTNTCSNGICGGGLAAGTTCKNVYDCQPGLYCNFALGEPFKCTEQVGLGMNCTSEFDCENYLGCNLGTCVKYYSLSNGEMTDSLLSSGGAELCSSGYAVLTTTEEPLVGICSPAPVSSGPTPIECTIGTMCQSFNNLASKPCSCGYNGFGKSYCPLFEGDTPLVLAIYNVFLI